ATGEAERLAAEAMLLLRPDRRRITLGADKGYDAAAFVATCTAVRVAPHIARNQSGRRSNIAEEVFAWVKVIAGWRKTRHRGLARVGWQFTLALAAYNLIRLPKLLATA
ncbi:MAG TPA: transposase, partial [Alphaproteobacteria bacterium]|nr:transposase [Alphaproteobacteria bacterium]